MSNEENTAAPSQPGPSTSSGDGVADMYPLGLLVSGFGGVFQNGTATFTAEGNPEALKALRRAAKKIWPHNNADIEKGVKFDLPIGNRTISKNVTARRRTTAAERKVDMQYEDLYLRSLHGLEKPAGEMVDPSERQAGSYILGPRLQASKFHYEPIVCLCRSVKDKQQYAIKMLTIPKFRSGHVLWTPSDHSVFSSFHNECSILEHLRGESGIVQIKDFFTEYCHQEVYNPETGRMMYNGEMVRRACLVTECLIMNEYTSDSFNYINLQQYLAQNKTMPEAMAMKVFYNIVDIIARLHEKNIVHRDIRIGNIVMLRSSYKVKLMNFSLAHRFLGDDDTIDTYRGFLSHVPPECMGFDAYYGKACDVWSLGILLFSMIYGTFPFFGRTIEEMLSKIRKETHKVIALLFTLSLLN